jgi:RND family efflux transporter MFP subunit
MQFIEPDPGPPPTDAPETTEEILRRENQDLKRQLEQLKSSGNHSTHSALPAKLWHPSSLTIWSISLGVIALIVAAFFAGYIPLQKRKDLISSEELQQEQALPQVEVIQVGRSTRNNELQLPGNIQAISEAPVLARASGYILRRMVDIGDRVRAGQPLAEIEAPELDEQVRQATASRQQAQAALDQALANLEQGKSDLEFARATSQRWSHLFTRGVVSRQENEQYQTQYQSKAASVKALEEAISVQRSNGAAAEANLRRLQEMQKFLVVKAPFTGIITLRNVDVGALVNASSTLLFRVAEAGTVRVYVNVPQINASFIRPGQPARLQISSLPGRDFAGAVARTANSLDPSSRTMLVEVHVPNSDGALLPGMYAQVDLDTARTHPPLLVPSDALIVRSDGTSVAVVRPDRTVHLQKVEVGRDYGDRLEVLGGLQEGDTIIPNPGDFAREGVEVNPVRKEKKGPDPVASKGEGK